MSNTVRMSSRRELLRVGLSGAAAVSMASSVPAFLADFAFAKQPGPDNARVANDNILVVIQLTGGNDGLNTVIPHADDAYFKARPKIGIRNSPVKLSDRFSLNPWMSAFKPIFDEGQ